MSASLELIARLKNEASPEVRQLAGDLGILENATEEASAAITQQEAAQKQLDTALGKSKISSEALAAAQNRLAAETDPEKATRFAFAQRQLDIATERAKVSVERLAAAQNRLDAETDPQKQVQLEAAVNSAKIAVDQQALSVDRLKDRIIQLDKANDNAKTNSKSFGSQFQGVATQIAVAGAAITGAVVAIKEGFEFAQEGAQLDFVRQKFDSLVVSIGSSSSSMLSSLQEVTRGTMTTAEQMELASQIINLGLAKDEEGVTRLANVVTNLGLDMQQVIMTFANDSKMRLDALGLSVTDVEERTKKYEAAGVAATEAFDLAVLDALEAKLGVVGSAADSAAGSYDRLTTAFEESTNRLKEQVGMGLEPAVSATADYMTARRALLDAYEAGEISLTQANLLTWKFLLTEQTAAEVADEYTTLLQDQAHAVETAARKSEEMGAAFEIVVEQTSAAAWTNYQEYIPSVIEARLQEQAAINVHQETETSLQELALTERELTYTTNMAVDAGKDAAAVRAAEAAAADQLAEQLEKLNAISGDYFVSAVNATDGTAIFGQAMNEAGELAESATLNEEALNQAIFDTADKAGASATELALLGGALGLYSEQAVDAAIKSAAIQSEIDRLVQLAKEGTISWGSIKDRVMDFASTLEEGFPPVEVDTSEAMTNINELALAAEAAAGTYEVHYAVTSDPIPDFPGGGAQGGGGRDPNEAAEPFGTGGYTGAGADDEVAGQVHRNEYVFDSAATRRLGVPFLENLRQGGNVATQTQQTAVSAPSPVAAAAPSVVIQIMGGDLAQVQTVVRRELERVGITAQNYQRMK